MATMPPRIAELARTVMRNPVEVEIAVSKPADNISQCVYVCAEAHKPLVLKKVFEEHPPRRVILFCSSKQKVKELAIVLKRKGYNVRAMHSDLEQKERDEVINLFRAAQIDLMVATDIVARGLDIDDITMVINYDAPHDAEDYVHRIGRTARAGKDGRAVTLIGEKDLPRLSQIERVLHLRIPRAELPEGVSVPQKGGRDENHRGRGGEKRSGKKGRRGDSGKKGEQKKGGEKKASHKKMEGENKRSEETKRKRRHGRGRSGKKNASENQNSTSA